MNQGFWMAKGAAESINDGEVNYDNSTRIDAKRSHQWYMDAAEAELFPNKKQAVGGPTNNFFTGLLNSNIYPWPNASGFQPMSGHCSERLFDSEASRTVNSDDRNIPSASSVKGHMERKLDEDPFGNDSSFGLSMSHTLEDPRSCLNYSGIRKVKVSQVKEPENVMPLSMEPAYNRMDGNTMSAAHAYSRTDENTMSMNLAYSKGEGNIMSIGDTYGENNIFISMGQPYHKEDENVSMAQAYKENNTTLAMGHVFSKGDSNIISMAQTYNMAEENPILVGHIYGKGNENYIPTCQSHNKGDNSNVSLAQSCNKGESTMISFGGYDEDDANTSGRLISNYGLLIAQSSLQQRSDVTNEGDLVNSSVDVILSNALGAQNASRKKEDLKTSKKATPNSFSSNVRSLLSTGMLDGVPVKYIAWSKEKELRGVIRGSGYLCGCQSCNYAKVVNAYEFERHANCKTKHPNNHIYFENGKTIYAIVQELRSTPQNMLFEVIQTITGSPINQKSFRLWKESFLAATRELQRIYGPDDGKPL